MNNDKVTTVTGSGLGLGVGYMALTHADNDVSMWIGLAIAVLTVVQGFFTNKK